MDNNLEGSTLTIDLNSDPIQNPNEAPNSEIEGTYVGDMRPLSNEHQGDEHELLGEISRLKSENRKLTDLLAIVMSKNLSELKQRQSEEEENSRKRKRKRDDENRENISSSNVVRSNISRVYVRIDPSDDSMVVRDGYQWRKYGQKVTRDNPSPRAYYKCSFAPACPVKKKVQRSVDDPTLLVATYEGEHHHHSHNHHQCHSAPADSPTASPPGLGSSSTPRSDDRSKIQGEVNHDESDEMQQFLVEKMASSLTRNRGFTTALAAAITGRIFNEVFSSDNYVSDDVNISNSRGFPT